MDLLLVRRKACSGSGEERDWVEQGAAAFLIDWNDWNAVKKHLLEAI